MQHGPELVLASASPRRRMLLSEAGLEFRVAATHADETLSGAPGPERAASELAQRKARAALEQLDVSSPKTYVIAADTVVAIPLGDCEPAVWRLLGKPADAQAARESLQRLSGSRHAVVTGVACAVAGVAPRIEVDAETTWVTMRAIAEHEIEAYVESDEWRGKAGGYAIQESADAFVTQLEGGGFDNVVGLPVALTLELLGKVGAPLEQFRTGGHSA